ncbi:MAG: hypothetical protein JW943_08940 [Deltaproteobacteria bacterium]|nr:hypothetical protein [Deltaproteobacteria bacterium]
MNKRSIIIYWLILFVPTVAIGVAAFHLLSHEKERMEQAARSSSYERARLLSEHLRLSVNAAEEQLMHSLRRIPGEELQQTLFIWEEKNPLIRNVFIWQPGGGLKYPQTDVPSESEQGRFLARYHALFSGRLPWHTAMMNGAETYGTESSVSPQKAIMKVPGKKILEKDNINKTGKGASRNDLASMAKDSRTHPIDSGERNIPAGKNEGWIPWFSENSLYILGWVRMEPNGVVFGVELELMALLSRLTVEFPAVVSHGIVYALLDDGGHILHQSGGAILKGDSKPEMTISLLPHLPHWQVAVYFVEGGPAAQSARTFIIFTGLMMAIFIAAVILGGSLLVWQAHRNMVDARQKTSFVSNVSHELKTPLTSIRMYAELLNEDRIKEPGKRKHYLQVIIGESERLTRLVNNVLDFSRLEQGRKKFHIEELDMAAYIRDIINSHRLRIQEAGLIIQEEIPEAPVLVRTDRDAMEQVILNLLDNAVKYAAGGHEISIHLDISQNQHRLMIMDRGPGVPRAHRENIFKKFHRVDDSLTSSRPGSGLGLGIARGLMRGLGGDLLYEEREGGGSCFTVLF